jgi:hypothetical protein
MAKLTPFPVAQRMALPTARELDATTRTCGTICIRLLKDLS